MPNAIPRRQARLLREVAAAILEEPLRYDQTHWLWTSERASCGTAGCIAGWLTIVAAKPGDVPLTKFAKEFDKTNVHNTLAKVEAILGTGVMNLAKDAKLFEASGTAWPKPFSGEWWMSRYILNLEERVKVQAKIAAARIEHFIKTGE